ncbi:MAG: hypothetical protein ASARMPREDX12_008381 [Alectoria sarmentosa]|nr:MAG: hypothetical protein ASARMPREDX12_008381 [Alectoria sarmentosa]
MPTESLYPKFNIPNTDLWGFLFERNDRPYPEDKIIYRDADTGRAYSYAQVKSTAIELGKGLKSVWEWRKGDVLALFTPNCIDTPAITWGVHWAGGVVSPANPGYTAEELAFQLKDSGAKALATQKPFLKVAVEAATLAGIPQDRIILMGDEKDESMRFKHFSSIRNIAGTNRYRRTKAHPKNDLAFLVYSSGTTGHPKGVMLCHENIISNLLMLKAGEGSNLSWDGGPTGNGDNILAFLPFFHIYVVLLLGKHPIIDKYDLSSLRMLNSGAAPLTQELVEAVYKRLKVPIKQGYGLSETSPTTHTQPWELWDKTVGSVGTLLPMQTAKYMSPEEKELPIGETGELWIKGPNVFKGYHNNPEGTKNALTEDGFFKTGDVGHQDKDGNFYITDRVKELIKYKGFQVPPAELEGLLISHPTVNDVAVIGIYNKDQATEVPRAYIVPKPGVEGSPKTANDIMQWLQAKVANHKRLRGGVRFVDEVPKTASGKILRRLLKVKAQEEEEKGQRAKL